ncbi:TPA: hypothetical protein EYP83_02745 [Candidatus Geothermarchaeota archaeon]|nr:hypothetical protein [Candidatus Geothermarchaeota archaeon]
MKKKYRVSNFTLQFILSTTRGTLENIILTLEVDGEEKRMLKMYNIPLEIAWELEKYSDNGGGLPTVHTDFRFSIFDILMELPDIEGILRNSIEEIVIDRLHPESNVFSAEVKLKNNYSGLSKKVRMVPSHAVLLSIMGNIPLYISEDLLEYTEVNTSHGEGEGGEKFFPGEDDEYLSFSDDDDWDEGDEEI